MTFGKSWTALAVVSAVCVVLLLFVLGFASHGSILVRATSPLTPSAGDARLSSECDAASTFRVQLTANRGDGDRDLGRAPPITFGDFVRALAASHLGPLSGTFDVDALPTLAEAQAAAFFDKGDTRAAATVLPCAAEASILWNIGMRSAMPPGPPSCLVTFGKGLATIRTYISLALSRLVFDAELEATHASLQSAIRVAAAANEHRVAQAATNALHEFRFAAVRVIAAHVQHAVSAMQTLYDGHRPGSVTDIVAEFRKTAFASGGGASSGGAEGAAGGATAATNPGHTSYANLARWLARRVATSAGTLATGAETPEYGQQPPVEGKFWNILRTEIGCATLERSCENPEGCRFLCNREYLLRGGRASERANRGTARGDGAGADRTRSCRIGGRNNDTIAVLEAVFGGRVAPVSGAGRDSACVNLVSLGSNNEFDWEVSVTGIVDRAGAPLGRIGTFDCTLAGGVRPSPTMKRIGGKFKFFPYCIGIADAGLDSFAKKTTASASSGEGKSVSLVEVGSLVFTGSTTTAAAAASAPAQQVSILKMDIESFEFVAVPRWQQVELALAGAAFRKSSPGARSSPPPPISFSELPLMTVEQLQTEIHRRGHKGKKAAGFAGAMWLQWLLLGYHGLGFAVVAQEKNHVDNCCFEAVLAHQRFYISSQAWHAAATAP